MRFSSLAFMTAPHRYSMYSTDCTHLSLSTLTLPRLCIPFSKKSYYHPSFPQKHYNKHPLLEPHQPPRTHFHASGFFLAKSALFIGRFNFDARGRLVTSSRPVSNPMVRTQRSTRSVGSTHTSWIGRGLSSPELQMRPSHARR